MAYPDNPIAPTTFTFEYWNDITGLNVTILMDGIPLCEKHWHTALQSQDKVLMGILTECQNKEAYLEVVNGELVKNG